MDPLPVFRLDADTAARGGAAEALERFDAARGGRARRHPDGRQGPRLPRRDARRGARRRRHAALPRLPRRGAHLRARRPARRPQRPRRPRGGRVVVQALDPGAPALRHAARHDADGFLDGELDRREALSYPPYGSLIRVVCSSHEARAGEGRGGRACWSRSRAAGSPCSARRRCSGSRAASASSSWSRRATARPAIARRPRGGRGDRRRPLARRGQASPSTSTRSRTARVYDCGTVADGSMSTPGSGPRTMRHGRRARRREVEARSEQPGSTPRSSRAGPRRCRSSASSATRS